MRKRPSKLGRWLGGTTCLSSTRAREGSTLRSQREASLNQGVPPHAVGRIETGGVITLSNLAQLFTKRAFRSE